MNIRIDRDSKTPVYEQIREQVESLVRDGLLPAGTRMPSVRDLALALGVSVKTVRTAYDELGASNIIDTKHGSGTFVASRPDVVLGSNLRTREEMGDSLEDLPPMRWEPYFFRSEFFGMPRSKRFGDSLLKFSQASPDPSLFPFERIKQIATTMLWYPKEFFFDRGNPQGYQPLVEFLEKEMALAGVPMAEGENDIILTGGFQRALSLVLDLLVRPGQKVAIESPSHTSVLNLLISKRIEHVAIPMDGDGMDTDYLATALALGEIKAIITAPTFHNPTGTVLSKGRREHLIKLAARHRVPIIEDDWARHLRFEGEAVPPLKSLDRGGYVIHIGTFSKCFLPGLRIGWITCPAPMSVPLVLAKAGADVGDSYFLQAMLHEFILKGHFDKHLRKSNKEYKARRDAMCQTLSAHLPSGCRFRIPQGGFSVWVELPANMMSFPLLGLARNAGVEFLPATFCTPDRSDMPAMRLSFARHSVQDIETGVKALCSVLADCLENPELLQYNTSSFEELFQ